MYPAKAGVAELSLVVVLILIVLLILIAVLVLLVLLILVLVVVLHHDTLFFILRFRITIIAHGKFSYSSIVRYYYIDLQQHFH